MLNCLFCQPLNSFVKSVQDIAIKYRAKKENKKQHRNKNHKNIDTRDKSNDNARHYEDITSDNEFMKRYKLLNNVKVNEQLAINGNTNSCLVGKDNDALLYDRKSINKVISSIKCLTSYMKMYSNNSHFSNNNNFNLWIRDSERKYLKRWTKQRLNERTRETYNYLFTEYACLPKKHAPSVLYKICYILDHILPHVGYITFNAWRNNKFNKRKLIKLHTIHLYLLYARKELLTATEYYIANKEQQLVKQKMDSLWWALNAAKKQLYHIKKKSQINVKHCTHISSRKSCQLKKLSMFNMLKNCCLDGNFLKYKRNPLRRCITDHNIPKQHHQVLSAFRIDKKTLIRRPQSK